MECPPFLLELCPPLQLRTFPTQSPALPAFGWNQIATGGTRLYDAGAPIVPPPSRARVYDDDDDDDINIDTTGMTQEEKDELKAQRKLKKMNREKRKRSKLNDQFDHLCRMLQMGKTTRVEKLAVLNQTIRVLCQLKAENARLKDQRYHMKELLNQRQKGVPVVESLIPAKSRVVKPEPQTTCHLPSFPGLEKHLCGALFPPGIPPPAFPQEVWLPPTNNNPSNLNNNNPCLKQDMWFPGAKPEIQVQQKPAEDAMVSWTQFFQPPARPSDLDFAFGDEGLTRHLERGEAPFPPAFEPFTECDFKPCILPLPKPDVVDCVDMFFTTEDPSLSDLLA